MFLHYTELNSETDSFSKFQLLFSCFPSWGSFTVHKIVFLNSVLVKLNLCTEKPQPKYSTETSFNSRIQILQLTTSNIFFPSAFLATSGELRIPKTAGRNGRAYSIHKLHHCLERAERPCDRRIKAEDEDTASWNPPTASPEPWLYVWKIKRVHYYKHLNKINIRGVENSSWQKYILQIWSLNTPLPLLMAQTLTWALWIVSVQFQASGSCRWAAGCHSPGPSE